MLDNTITTHVADRMKDTKFAITSFSNLEAKPIKPYFEFIIRVDGKEVWSGMEMEQPFVELLSQYPNGKFSIGWRSSPMVMV